MKRLSARYAMLFACVVVSQAVYAQSSQPDQRVDALFAEYTRGLRPGLADALHGSGVRLLTVRPGFVVGRMTEGMEPAPFASTAAQVAAATARALAKGRRTVWVPAILRPVFAVMRLLPQFVWRRLPR